jgi:hypothetical protein
MEQHSRATKHLKPRCPLGLLGHFHSRKPREKLLHDIERLNECATTAGSQLSTPDLDGLEEHSNTLRFYLFGSEMSAHKLSEVTKRMVALATVYSWPPWSL